ncbi:hypothetical protein CDAR_442491 [Caerostris darwini]|uniref:Uncharacterized protein n=1 Tax=Caerostris darwini TaxID=1538125 RepID=A0AAV4V0M9_9ARAC|nr:hypothetical protein CDAR_442491 [Caerostris darwini]
MYGSGQTAEDVIHSDHPLEYPVVDADSLPAQGNTYGDYSDIANVERCNIVSRSTAAVQHSDLSSSAIVQHSDLSSSATVQHTDLSSTAAVQYSSKLTNAATVSYLSWTGSSSAGSFTNSQMITLEARQLPSCHFG